MTPALARVELLVWRPANPGDPGDLAAGWPEVLQVRAGASPWRMPGVALRAGEPVRAAAARIAYAIGLTLPARARVLSAHRQRATPGIPVRLTLVVDGGWVAPPEVPSPAGMLASCRCHPATHHRRWAHAATTNPATLDALRAALSHPVRENSQP
ncbi:hypothetical protein H8N01_06895 [Streptomyces sp. AC536]|uniref:hypothetical protein n=1 Tax=Streptomyces buecherae TaxID=2763006 RepID=UPI00164DCC08|nr:hypothetical protein [Streptomyces buecherae]MBC3982294.1 hypothetical protein [Streptomyces buecherae]QNJ41630.1 hypothetical protein H7H31_18920 [Streptomyces buecherae]